MRKGGLWISLNTGVFFFTVTVRELEFSRREFQIPRPVHSKREFFTLGVKPQVTQTQNIASASIGEHRRASALLRNIQNIRICMGKKPTVSVTYENERISIKNSLPYLKCVLRLSCVVHGPNYGRFMGFYVNGFLFI